jgi:hypothetical protein
MPSLQPINPDAPNVFNGITVSYGIAPILGAISDVSRSGNRKAWNLYIVNVETLIRDRRDNTATTEQTARNVIVDCTVLAQYIATYNAIIQNTHTKMTPIICFYMGHYENIPTIYKREKYPKGTEERWEIRDRVGEIIATDGFIENFEGSDIIFSVEKEKHSWCHKTLLKSLGTRFDNIPFRTTLLISHVCSDFHLYRVFKDFTILESYTGRFKGPREFGKKVFDSDVVPFNKYTHLLLGDKWYVKCQVDNKIKKEVKKRAESGQWNLLPDKSVLEQILTIPSLGVSATTLINTDI